MAHLAASTAAAVCAGSLAFDFRLDIVTETAGPDSDRYICQSLEKSRLPRKYKLCVAQSWLSLSHDYISYITFNIIYLM